MPLTRRRDRLDAMLIKGVKPMAEHVGKREGRFLNPWRIAGWGLALLLLALPAVANAPWTASDFVVMGVVFAVIGLGVEFLVRKSGNLFYRAGAVAALLATFLTIWVNLAVGMIGDLSNPLKLMFAGVLALAWGGAAVARFQAAGMAWAMVVAAVAQAAAGAIGMSADSIGGSLSMTFAVPWLFAAALFHKAAREQASASAAA
jgi:hypothetical protein